MIRVLITGMSGTGKSALVAELRRRDHVAYDADEDGYIELRPDGRWEWRVDEVAALLARSDLPVLFLAGCSVEQARFAFDLKVLLTVPEAVLTERLRTRATNSYGRGTGELDQVRADLRAIEPLLRRSADLEIDTRLPVQDVADLVLRRVRPLAEA